jgi:hypothetical protein
MTNKTGSGLDPLFAQVDGATCPAGTVNKGLTVNNGLIRIGLQVPHLAHFGSVA